MSSQRLFLLDASSYLFRAYFAVGHLSNSKGIPTNATYGFVQMLLKLIKDEKPDHLVAVFDRPEPTFRKKEFEAYKAQREEMPNDLAEQIPWIKKIIAAMKIPLLEKPGFEADDIIGTIAKKMEEKDLEVVIVTGDKDLMQLVSDQVILLDTMRDRWTNREKVIERFGVGPEKVIDVLGLAGDTSDNIPGVPGIGEKTASALIQQFGSIEELYQRLDELKGKRRENLEQNKEKAFLSKRLVTIHTEVPIDYQFDDFVLSEPDKEELFEIFKELEFGRLLGQFASADFSPSPQPSPSREEGDSNSSPHPWRERVAVGRERGKVERSHYTLVNTTEGLNKLIQELEQFTQFSFDTETTSLDVNKAELVGLSFCVNEEGKAYYLPIAHQTEENLPQLSLDEVLEKLKPVLEDQSKKKIAQNFKYDYQILKKAGVEVQGLLCDTMIAAYLLEPSKRHNLDQLSLEYLNHKTISYEEVTEQDKNKTFADVPILKAMEYSGEDADVTFKLSKIFLPKIKEENLEKVLNEIELPLVPILAEMELLGIKIDRSFLQNLQTEFDARIKKSETKIYELAGSSFNINSTKQLAEILFEKLKLPVKKKTKTGYSTNIDVLTELAELHDLPKEILDYRSLAKLKSTYIDSLLNQADPNDDRVHTSFNQTIAETGRLSSSDPNLQNIPIRSEDGKKIRQAFIPDSGFTLLSADYSQIELRILAHLSEDPVLVEAFQNEEDIHKITASTIFNLPIDQITSSMRATGKTVNFSVIYGQSSFGLSNQLGITPQKAKEYIEGYFSKYASVGKYRDQVLKQAREAQLVHTLYGRRRRVPDLLSANFNIRSIAERVAFNTVIQGTAADLIKLAMIQIQKRIFDQKMKSHMLLQVHDELVFEVYENELEEMKKLVRHEMENVVLFKVPIKVEIGIGKNWGEAHP